MVSSATADRNIPADRGCAFGFRRLVQEVEETS